MKTITQLIEVSKNEHIYKLIDLARSEPIEKNGKTPVEEIEFRLENLLTSAYDIGKRDMARRIIQDIDSGLAWGDPKETLKKIVKELRKETQYL